MNVFESLVRNAVPGIVLFCICVGAALIGMPEKDRVIRGFETVGDAIARVNGFIVRLTPYGVFAIAAAAAGTMSVEEFGRLRGYLLVFTLAALILSFWVFPALVATFTPFGYREVLRSSREALVIAFATGKVLVVLPILIQNTQRMFEEHGDDEDESVGPSVEVLYPLSYPFPHLGKVIAILFVPFAAAFVGRSLELVDYGPLFGLGTLSLFGGPILTVPLLLDFNKVPSDMMQLFILSGVYTSRLGDAVGVMNLVAFTVITTCAMAGRLEVQWARLGGVVLVTAALVGVTSAGSLALLGSVKDDYERSKILADMHLAGEEAGVDVVVRDAPGPNPVPLAPGESRLERIRRSGLLRVGFNDDNLPYAFRNARGELVGMDVDMAIRLARDLGVELELVPFERGSLAQQIAADHFDVAMSGLVGTLGRQKGMRLSRPYLDATLSLVVRDYRARELDTLEELLEAPSLRVGVLTESQFQQMLERRVPRAETILVPSTRWYFEEEHDLDGLMLSAEAGAAWTILHPDFEVVVPTRRRIGMPLVYATAPDDVALGELVDFWVSFQERTGAVASLHDYWIRGEGAHPRAPRWSIIRNVLGWIE